MELPASARFGSTCRRILFALSTELAPRQALTNLILALWYCSNVIGGHIRLEAVPDGKFMQKPFDLTFISHRHPNSLDSTHYLLIINIHASLFPRSSILQSLNYSYLCDQLPVEILMISRLAKDSPSSAIQSSLPHHVFDCQASEWRHHLSPHLLPQ